MLRSARLDYRGCGLSYRIEGSGPPLLMIQGVGTLGLSPNPQIQALSQHYTCLSFDNRGIGSSQPVGAKLTVEQMADDCLTLLDEAGWESAHVVGHSLGGLTAMQLALQARHRVRSLTLLCSFARGASATSLSLKFLWIALRIRLGTRTMKRQAFLEMVLSDEERKRDTKELTELLAGVLGHDVADIPPVAGRQLAAMRAHDVTSRLGELAGVPTLILSGAEDPIARPELGAALAKGIPGSRYVEVAGTSHGLPVLQPDFCATLILEHLAAVELAPGR